VRYRRDAAPRRASSHKHTTTIPIRTSRLHDSGWSVKASCFPSRSTSYANANTPWSAFIPRTRITLSASLLAKNLYGFAYAEFIVSCAQNANANAVPNSAEPSSMTPARLSPTITKAIASKIGMNQSCGTYRAHQNSELIMTDKRIAPVTPARHTSLLSAPCHCRKTDHASNGARKPHNASEYPNRDPNPLALISGRFTNV